MRTLWGATTLPTTLPLRRCSWAKEAELALGGGTIPPLSTKPREGLPAPRDPAGRKKSPPLAGQVAPGERWVSWLAPSLPPLCSSPLAVPRMPPLTTLPLPWPNSHSEQCQRRASWRHACHEPVTFRKRVLTQAHSRAALLSLSAPLQPRRWARKGSFIPAGS